MYKSWTSKQRREGGRECWMFRVKERVGGSSEVRQQGFTVKRGRGERACLRRNVTVFSVWEMGRTDCAIPGVEEG